MKECINELQRDCNPDPLGDMQELLADAEIEALNLIKDSLDTLEVKKVKGIDLEKEVDKWRHNHFHGRRDKDASGEYLERSSQLDIAEHFFNLGLISQDNKI